MRQFLFYCPYSVRNNTAETEVAGENTRTGPNVQRLAEPEPAEGADPTLAVSFFFCLKKIKTFF